MPAIVLQCIRYSGKVERAVVEKLFSRTVISAISRSKIKPCKSCRKLMMMMKLSHLVILWVDNRQEAYGRTSSSRRLWHNGNYRPTLDPTNRNNVNEHLPKSGHWTAKSGNPKIGKRAGIAFPIHTAIKMHL